MMNISKEEKEILRAVADSRRFPIVRFELRSTKEEELVSTALNHVWITDTQDSMETVKARAAVLQSLQEKKLIKINYSMKAWVASDYKIYYASKLYEMLCHMVLEGQNNPKFLFDMPYMKRGMVTLTKVGSTFAKL